MAIEWTTQPVYGYGDGARPVGLRALYYRLYPYYSDSWTFSVMPFGTNSGMYMIHGAGGFLSQYNVTDGNIRGYVESAAIGDAEPTYPYSKTGITILFTSARIRFSLVIEFTSATQMKILTRFYDMDNNNVTSQINHQSFSQSLSWATEGLLDPGPPCQFAVYYNDAENDYFGITYNYTAWASGNLRCYPGSIMLKIAELAADLQQRNPDIDFGVWETVTESPEAGPASSTGGYGGYGGDITASDSIAVPALPTASAAGLGFINMYNPTAGGLSSLGEEIFPDLDFTSIVDPTGNSVIDAILNACAAFVDCFNQIPKMFEIFINSRLIDYVQDCHIVPVAPTTGTSAHIKLGFRELDTTALTITNEYVEVNLGTVNVNEFYGQFIDYQPYTRAKLFLPFVGFVPIEPEYWQSGTLGVVYHFNVYDGSFMAFVTASPNGKVSQMSSSVIGQYAGTAIVHLPLTGLNYSSMVAGLVGGVGAASNAIAGGNVAAGLTAAINTATSSPQVLSSNAYTASAAFMGCRIPFLIIERSVSHFPQNYQHDVGIPSKITTILASASGFTTIGDIDLSSVSATDREKDEIRSILASGIYV